MHRHTISRHSGNSLFGYGDRVHRRNIDAAPMRGGIRL